MELSARRDTRRLERTVEILRDALATAEQEGNPRQLAIARNNLGHMLGQLGSTTGNKATLDEAVSLCRRGLSEVDRDEAPLLWAVS